jgi:trk system potassium uptake protein TrkH
MKCIRWILLFKGIHRTLRQHIHPRAVLPVRLGGQAVPEGMMTAVWSFGASYFIVMVASTLALAAMNLDLLTAFSAAASALGNVGIGLGQVGPAEHYGHLPGLAKGVLCLDMFLGRLEFFTLMILFLPEFWKK